MADMDQKRSSFKTVSRNHLLMIIVNKIIFFGSKIGQTKHKPLRTRDFLRFFPRNCGLQFDHLNSNHLFQVILESYHLWNIDTDDILKLCSEVQFQEYTQSILYSFSAAVLEVM